jgi:hypothetical protein
MSPQMWMYVSYLGISVALTGWVARVLYANGTVFLAEVFGDYRLAGSVNRLLAVGFYLINFGVVALTLRIGSPVRDAQQVVEQLSVKLGVVMLLLGLVHLVNITVLNGFSRRRTYTS